MRIAVIKLITGEEIVGEILSYEADVIEIKNTLSIVLQPGRDGGMSFGFVPWAPLVVGPKKIDANKVIFVGDANDDLRNNYSSMFGGIVTPPKQLIV